MKASVHFSKEEWEVLKAKIKEEQKRIGYKISVNKYLRKLILGEVTTIR